MEILYGIIGAMLCICSFFMGISLGRKWPEKLEPITISDEEKLKRHEEIKAYEQLFSYSPEIAYGSNR